MFAILHEKPRKSPAFISGMKIYSRHFGVIDEGAFRELGHCPEIASTVRLRPGREARAVMGLCLAMVRAGAGRSETSGSGGRLQAPAFGPAMPLSRTVYSASGGGELFRGAGGGGVAGPVGIGNGPALIRLAADLCAWTGWFIEPVSRVFDLNGVYSA